MFCAVRTHIFCSVRSTAYVLCSVLFCYIQSNMFSFSAQSTVSHTNGTAGPDKPLKNYRANLLNTLWLRTFNQQSLKSTKHQGLKRQCLAITERLAMPGKSLKDYHMET